MRLPIVLAALALAWPAYAQQPENAQPQPDAQPQPNLEVGSGLVCDTKEQVERFVALNRGDPKAAADAVNAEAGKPEACAFGIVAFVRGADVAEVRDNEDRPLKIAEILVLGVGTPAGLVKIEPVRWFTAFPAEEIKI